MKIKKNGKVVNLTESDLQRITKRFLNEDDDPKSIVIGCIIENTTLKDLTSIPEYCVKMIMEKDITMALKCGMEMDYEDAKRIISKIEPISKCVLGKMKDDSKTY
jgi:hypothetical protein